MYQIVSDCLQAVVAIGYGRNLLFCVTLCSLGATQEAPKNNTEQGQCLEAPRFKDDQEQSSAKPRLGGVFFYLLHGFALAETTFQAAQLAYFQPYLVPCLGLDHGPQ